MSDVVMKEEGSDTLSVKELDVVLPRYQPFNGYTSPFDFILPPYKQFHGSSNYVGVCKPPPPQELIPIKEAEAELENLHLPSSEEVSISTVLFQYYPDFDAVLPLDLMISPSLNPDSTPDYDFSNYPQFSAPCQVTYTPTPPGGHLVLSYNSRNDAFYAEPLLCAKTGLHCYNLENGTNFERSRSAVPEVAEHTGVLTLRAWDPARACLCKFETKVWYPTEKKDCFHVITSRCRTLPPPPPEEEEKEESGFDTLSLDELFKGNMPDWLPGDSKLHYYEMKESEVEQAKEWLLLYAELAWYTKKQTDPEINPQEQFRFLFHKLKLSEIFWHAHMVDGQTDEVFLDHLHAATFQYTPLGRTILGPAHNVKINKVLTPMSRRMTRNKCDRWFGDRGSHFCHHLDHLITHTRFLINILKTYKVVVIVVDGTLRVITFSINAGKQDNVEMNASLKMLDICNVSKDVMTLVKHSLQDLQLTLRGNESSNVNEKIAAYDRYKNKLKKETLKCLKNNMNGSSGEGGVKEGMPREQNLLFVAEALKEARIVVVTMVGSLFSLGSA
ncbi:unnamed protein product [Brassica oleracea var. botrytis]